jgi:hypothetical protein
MSVKATALGEIVSATLHHVTVQLFIVGEAAAAAVKTNGSNINNLLPLISNTTPPCISQPECKSCYNTKAMTAPARGQDITFLHEEIHKIESWGWIHTPI